MSKGIAKFFEDPFNGLNVFNNDKPNIFNKPLQLFADDWDAYVTQDTPDALKPYVQPATSALLNFVPGVGPLASAAFNTALNEGNSERAGNNLDWGSFGKDAAINFGTAAATMGANKLVSNANQANTAKAATDNFSPGSLQGAYNPAIAGTTAGYSGTVSAPNAIASANSFAPLSTNAFASFNPTKSAVELASSGTNTLPASSASKATLGQEAYKTAVNTTPKLVNEALTSTLAPKGTQPISGVFNDFSPTDNGDPGTGVQYGDILNAFGGPEGNIANPNGPRYDENAINNAVSRLGANSYLQENQARDTALPAGQYEAPKNTPYANRLDEINKGTTQSYNDLMDQIKNANNYYGVIDSNPGLTAEDLDKYLADPSGGVLGSFSVPQESMSFLQGIKPLRPQNSSLL